MSTQPWPPGASSRKVWLPSVNEPGSAMPHCGVRLPSSSAASAMNGLYVEPGG